MSSQVRPAEVTALSLLFVFGAVMSGLTVIMLLFRGGPLDALWTLNPHARDGLAAMGRWSLLLMAVVCVACGTAALGLWRTTRWGFWSAVIVLSVNLTGDTANAFIAHDWRTLIGLPIGGLMLSYLIMRRRIFVR